MDINVRSDAGKFACSVLGPVDLVGHDDANDEAVESEGRAEDLNDEHANESAWSLCVGQCSSRADHADTHSASKVGHTDDETSTDHGVARELSLLVSLAVSVDVCSGGQLTRENNGKDDAIDGDSLAENDADQILRLDSGHLDR
jgi:hypothetical protein